MTKKENKKYTIYDYKAMIKEQLQSIEQHVNICTDVDELKRWWQKLETTRNL